MIIQFDSKLDQKVKHINRYPDINISDQCGMVRRGIMCLFHMTCVITAICRQRYPARRYSIDSALTLLRPQPIIDNVSVCCNGLAFAPVESRSNFLFVASLSPYSHTRGMGKKPSPLGEDFSLSVDVASRIQGV